MSPETLHARVQKAVRGSKKGPGRTKLQIGRLQRKIDKRVGRQASNRITGDALKTVRARFADTGIKRRDEGKTTGGNSGATGFRTGFSGNIDNPKVQSIAHRISKRHGHKSLKSFWDHHKYGRKSRQNQKIAAISGATPEQKSQIRQLTKTLRQKQQYYRSAGKAHLGKRKDEGKTTGGDPEATGFRISSAQLKHSYAKDDPKINKARIGRVLKRMAKRRGLEGPRGKKAAIDPHSGEKEYNEKVYKPFKFGMRLGNRSKFSRKDEQK